MGVHCYLTSIPCVKIGMKNNKTKDRANRKQNKTYHDRKPPIRNGQGKLTDEFQESMQEDMRGPTEGMESVPAKQ